ncbi:hypothetical protein GJ496_011338 [Pomphorhynchus laevis]|nr:hypothetical protein GJ496_011338 [Pomphorhynchus laevis]
MQTPFHLLVIAYICIVRVHCQTVFLQKTNNLAKQEFDTVNLSTTTSVKFNYLLDNGTSANGKTLYSTECNTCSSPEISISANFTEDLTTIAKSTVFLTTNKEELNTNQSTTELISTEEATLLNTTTTSSCEIITTDDYVADNCSIPCKFFI